MLVAIVVLAVYVVLFAIGLGLILRAHGGRSPLLPALSETDVPLCPKPARLVRVPENTKTRRGAPGPGSAGGDTVTGAPPNKRDRSTRGPTARGVAMVATLMRGREPQAIVHSGLEQILVGSDDDIAKRVLRDIGTLKWRAERRGDGQAADEWVLVGLMASRCADRNVTPSPRTRPASADDGGEVQA